MVNTRVDDLREREEPYWYANQIKLQSLTLGWGHTAAVLGPDLRNVFNDSCTASEPSGVDLTSD